MNRLAKFVVKRSKLALFGFIALIMLSSIGGFQSFGALKGGGYDDKGSDSAKVSNLIAETYDQSDSEVVIIADFTNDLSDANSRADAAKLTTELEAFNEVVGVTSYYSLGEPASLRSTDNHAAYFFVDLNDEAKLTKVAAEISDEFTGDFASAKLYVAGFYPVNAEINTTIQENLARAESVAVPLTVILLIFVFGSLVSAGLPLMVGGLAIVGAFFFIWVSTLLTDTSIFALNLITGLGLGLGIDYALLMVNRFREERAAGNSVAVATKNTVNSAGRTVMFSGLTVAIVLSALSFFPQYFLRSFAIGGVAVVLLAVAGALIALPACFNLMGDRINKLKVLKGDLAPKDTGVWGGIARLVMKRPVSILLVTAIGLGGLVSLANGVQFGQVDDRVLPKDNRVVVASNIIRDRFDGREGSPVEVIIEGASQDDVTDYALELSKIEGIVRVQSTSGVAQDGKLDQGYAPAFADYKNGDYQRIVAVPNIEPRSSEGIDLTAKVRELTANGHKILVGGSAAVYTDSQAGITRQLPLAAGWVIGWTLLLLFLFTGSVLLPIKAVVLNIMSLGATLGFISWVFMQGQLEWLLGDFIVTGAIDTSSVVLIAIVAFGLSMDYELFLLGRIKELHDQGYSTNDSVAIGLQRSGKIITAAAVVLAVNFFAFITSEVTIMKMLGLGVAFAILLDATVVRALLVPALMRLFGAANWWAPHWMKKIYKSAGLEH
jgi:RND superfamily putative drug exporter